MPTTWNDIDILIVGAGTMGASLAQNYAQSGFNVGLLDISNEALSRGLNVINDELSRAKGRIFSAQEIDAIRSRIISGIDYAEACKGKKLQLVIEAATEEIDIKKKIFQTLDSLTRKHVVLATNSSSLNTNILSAATKRPDKVVWMHYFYLPHKNRGGEYAGTDTASKESISLARKFLKLGGKIPAYVRGSRKGGVADILFVALLLESTRMLEDGFSIPEIEEAGKRAFNIPIGFLELMDATGLPIGLYSMNSFSDSSSPQDPLNKAYGNFFTPRKNYVDLIKEFDSSTDKSGVRWIRNGITQHKSKNDKTVRELADRFLAISSLTATECVSAGLITIEDLEALAQNAFLWQNGPFALMKEIGSARLKEIVEKREALAKKQNQDFPVSDLLRELMFQKKPITSFVPKVYTDHELNGAVRRITLSNPRAANSMNNEVFEQLKQEFTKANENDKCKVIIFDTAPIKSFIAGADVRVFIERIKSGNYEAIRNDTGEWQHVLFHIMTGTEKPKIAIVDGQAFGGGVEVASAFALDPNSIVLITNRTTFALPETRLGIYPGLRGTLSFSQVIYSHTKDPETALALARYYILAGGISTNSPQILAHLGFADVIVAQKERDAAAETIAKAIIENKGKMISQNVLAGLPLKRLETELSLTNRLEMQMAQDVFNQADLLPTIYAQARGHLPLNYTGDIKLLAERAARRVADNSPNAVYISNYLISRGFEGFLKGIDNEQLAQFELEHHLRQVFEHPDALNGLEAMVNGVFPSFRRRYPLSR